MPDNYDQKTGGYGKRPIWQWVVIYLIAAVIVYGIVYYFFFANKSGYGSSVTNTDQTAQTTNTQTSTASSTAAASVSINNFSFRSDQLSVKAGTTVTWTNNDSTSHTVTSNDGTFDSGPLQPGATYSFTFKTPGTFSYHCTLHPTMKAAVVVTQ